MWPDVRADVVAEIFLQPALGSPACVAWRRVSLPDVGPSSSCPLDPGGQLFRALDVGLYVKDEAIWEDEWKHNVTTTSDHLKHHDVDLIFGVYQYEFEYVLRLIPKHFEIFVLVFPPGMPINTACRFRISRGINCFILQFSSHAIPY